MNAPNLFHTNGYQIIPSAIPSKIVESLLEHALTRAHQPELAAGDKASTGNLAGYGDPSYGVTAGGNYAL